MPAELPNRTTNGSRCGDAFNRLRENSRSHQPGGAPGVLTTHSIHGTFHEAVPVTPYDTSDEGFTHPFQIFRSDSETLKFKVSPGYLVTTGLEFQPTNQAAEFTLTAGTWYFYLDLTSTTATIGVTAALPTWSVNKIYIGKVTAVAGTPPTHTIRQILAENPQVPCA